MSLAPAIDPRVQRLKSTTFLGKRLTKRQIADIQETVSTFPKLSRTELGHTICEHLGWQTPNGSNRIQLARGRAGGARAPRDPDAAAEATPRAGPAEAGPELGPLRPAGAHRGAAGRVAAATAGAGPRAVRGGGVERVEQPG